MATVSRISGTPDLRRGWSNPVPPEVADYVHPWKANPVKHPAELAAENAARELEREAERRAANPDPRQSLRGAHGRLADAKSELDRLVGLRHKAGDLVVHLEERHAELVDLLRAGTKVVVDRLIVALGEDAEHLPTPKNDALQAQIESVAGRLAVARDALSELSEQHRRAVAAVTEAEAGVAVAAVGVAIDYCVGEGQHIEQLAADLNRRRADLYSLTSAVTSELRRVPFRAGLYLPAAVGRVLAGLDARVDPVWAAKLKRLLTDPEAEL